MRRSAIQLRFSALATHAPATAATASGNNLGSPPPDSNLPTGARMRSPRAFQDLPGPAVWLLGAKTPSSVPQAPGQTTGNFPRATSFAPGGA